MYIVSVGTILIVRTSPTDGAVLRPTANGIGGEDDTPPAYATGVSITVESDSTGETTVSG